MKRYSRSDRGISEATRAFAQDRFNDPSLIEWALELTSEQEVERDALRDLFDSRTKGIREPYLQAWRCIFEAWALPDSDDLLEEFAIRRGAYRTRRELVRMIVDAVAPRLKVEKAGHYHVLSKEKPPSKPSKLRHLLRPSVTSGRGLGPTDIGIAEENDRDYLVELGTALNAAVQSGLNLARSIGLVDDEVDLTTWMVRRVYFVPKDQHPPGGGEPDRHGNGFAPSTKLMFATVERLSKMDVKAARRLVFSWDVDRYSLYRRLFAAAARNSDLVDGDLAGSFLENLSDREFWWFSVFPEMAEMRALRWQTLNPSAASALEKRLLRGEPKHLIPAQIEPADIPDYRARHIRTELLRIESAGGKLSPKAIQWLAAAQQRLQDQPAVSVVYGFNPGVRIMSGRQISGRTFDAKDRHELLRQLASAYSEDGWNDDSQAASDYVASNITNVLDGLSSQPPADIAGKVWTMFGMAVRPQDRNVSLDRAASEDLEAVPEVERAFAMIAAEKYEILSPAAYGLANLFSSWHRLLRDRPAFLDAWQRVWPIAAAHTNSLELQSPLRDAAFNSAAGNLVASLSFPDVPAGDNLLDLEPWGAIFEQIGGTSGNAAVAAQYTLLHNLSYLYATAPEWTTKHLIEPLQTALAGEGLRAELWEAFANGQMASRGVVEQLVQPLFDAVMSADIADQVKEDLAEIVVFSIVNDMEANEEPAFPSNRAQQMIRMGGDVVRGSAVHALGLYLDVQEPSTFDARVERALEVFNLIWPKELTLSSRRVSEQLVRFAGSAGKRYADVAETILPYLTPFDCWSMLDFRLYAGGELDDHFKIIDTTKAALALLAVLEKTVGDAEDAVIPYDLPEAVRHILALSPKSAKDPRIGRLETLGRR